MAGCMADYLSSEPADYAGSELALAPQNVLVERAARNQVVHVSDDGSEEVVSLDEAPVFEVELSWEVLGEADAESLFDFYCSSGKADGRARTFYWRHPRDGNVYTARFASDLSRLTRPGGLFATRGVSLKVTGVKP